MDKKLYKWFFYLILLLISVDVHAADSNYIFLIDVSGSMEGKGDIPSPNIFSQVKQAIKTYLYEAIPSGSEVTIIPFAEASRSSKTFTISPSPQSGNAIEQYLVSLKADGKRTNIYGTLYDTLQLASEKGEGPVIIYLFTDGKDNVGAKTFEELKEKFNTIKKDNPFLWIYYTDLSAKKDNAELDKLGDLGIQMNPLDPTSRRLAEELEEKLKTQRQFIEEQQNKLLEEKSRLEEEKLAIQKNKDQLALQKQELESREADIQEQLTQLSEKKSEDAAKRAALTGELNRIQRQQKENADFRNDLLAKEKELAGWKKELQRTRLELDKAARQREEISRTLSAADKLVAESAGLEKVVAMASLQEAIGKYKSVLKKEKDNVTALAGLNKARQLYRARKNIFEKYWFYIAPGILAFLFFLLVIRRPLIHWWTIDPIVLNVSYNPSGNNAEPTVTLTRSFLRKRFRKKGDEYYIAGINGQNIQIEHKAVTPVRHARIFRKGNLLYIEKISGIVKDENNNPIEKPMKLWREESVFLSQDGSGHSVMIKLLIK